MSEEQSSRNRRKRKQPRMRRMETATAVPRPRLVMPKTAKRRRQRTRRAARLPVATSLRQFVFSARWVSLGLLSLCIYAMYLVGMNEQFYLTTIPVEGTISISPSEVVAQSGLAGVHVFAADPNRAAQQVAQLPGVLEAAVTLNWPNEVLVQIREDSPVALWVEGDAEYWITENGRLIPARSQSLGLLRIDSEPLTAVDANGNPANNEVAFVAPEVLAGALQLQALHPSIAALSYRPSSGLSFQDERGWPVFMGIGSDMNQKLVVYETIVATLAEQGLTPAYVSVSNQEKPYYRVQEG